MADWGFISLSLGAFAVTLDTFNSDGGFPRLYGEQPQPELAPSGAIVVPGSPYNRPEQWQFEAVLSKADAGILQNLYREHRRLLDNRQDGKILLTDTIREFEEIAPRTRAKAATPFDTEVTANGYVTYFAKFYVVFNTAPELKFDSVVSGVIQWAANLALIETGEKVAP